MSQSKLMLARDAAYFDLSTVDGRRWSCRALTDLFIDFQRVLLPKVIVEVGAFDAWFSREMRAHLPGSRSVAFEANPHNFEHFSQRYDFAKLGVDYRHMAISDRSGQTEFQLITKRNGQDAPTVKGDDSLLTWCSAAREGRWNARDRSSSRWKKNHTGPINGCSMTS